MEYNFDEIHCRRGTNALKWDSNDDPAIIPMWVADMDFKTCPAVTQALIDKAAEGIYGYGILPNDFFESIVNWYRVKHRCDIKGEWLQPASGIVPSISAIIRALLKSGDSILIQPPVYNHFFTVIERCGCKVVENNLIYTNGNYAIDFEDLELKASDPKVKLMLVCNPHNPVGRAWSRGELEKIAAICSRYGVVVVADEIHADLVLNQQNHVVFEEVAQQYNLLSFTCSSPCKSFNLSALSVSYLICRNHGQLTKVQEVLQMHQMETISPFAVQALIAAYTKGGTWLEQLKLYLFDNYQYLVHYCAKNLPGITISPLEATYLVWLDCRDFGLQSSELSQILIKQGKIWLNPGSLYGLSGEGFLRLNIALPRKLLAEGLKRFSSELTMLQKHQVDDGYGKPVTGC